MDTTLPITDLEPTSDELLDLIETPVSDEVECSNVEDCSGEWTDEDEECASGPDDDDWEEWEECESGNEDEDE